MKSRHLSLMLVCLSTCLLPGVLCGQQEDAKADKTKSEIKSLLQKQVDQWNQHDLNGFMQTYWKSEKLTFSSGGQTTRGWSATLDRYKKRYQSENAEMGKLRFDSIETELLGDHACYVLGRWYLQMKDEKLEGNFSLILRRFDDGWKIVHDHSSSVEEK